MDMELISRLLCFAQPKSITTRKELRRTLLNAALLISEQTARISALVIELAQYGMPVGSAQQHIHLARAALQALGLSYEDTSPSDITEAIAKLKRRQVLEDKAAQKASDPVKAPNIYSGSVGGLLTWEDLNEWFDNRFAVAIRPKTINLGGGCLVNVGPGKCLCACPECYAQIETETDCIIPIHSVPIGDLNEDGSPKFACSGSGKKGVDLGEQYLQRLRAVQEEEREEGHDPTKRAREEHFRDIPD